MWRRQLAVVGALVCGLAGAAAADTTWDGRYEHTGGGGNEKCPDAVPVVVTGGAFSFAWNIKLGDRVYRVGTIAGSVRPTGLAVFKATIFSPLAHETQAALEDAGDTVQMLQSVANEMTLAFAASDGTRGINLTSGTCYASWDGGAGKHGTVGKVSKAKPVKPPPPVAEGSAKWDATYDALDHHTDAWWCPKYDALGGIVVKKGRFSAPWHVDAVDGHGRGWGDITFGQIDGTISASGAVKLRPWFAITELPPEIADGREGKDATLAYVKAHTPAMTFTTVEGKHHAHLTFGKDCSYDVEVWGNTEDNSLASRRRRVGGGDSKTASTSKPTSSGSSNSSGGSTSSSNHSDKPASHPAPPPPPKGKANGASCSYADECASGHCNFNKCSSGDNNDKKLANGMACQYASDCASGMCMNNKCSTGSSNDKNFGKGAECQFPSDCASGECNFNKCD